MEIILFMFLGFIVWELVSIEKRLRKLANLLEQRQRPPFDSRFM